MSYTNGILQRKRVELATPEPNPHCLFLCMYSKAPVRGTPVSHTNGPRIPDPLIIKITFLRSALASVGPGVASVSVQTIVLMP